MPSITSKTKVKKGSQPQTQRSRQTMGKKKRESSSKIHIPDDVLFNIFKRLPAKSLMGFKCVSKSWKTLITNPYFAQLHHEHAETRPDASYLLFYLRAQYLSARSIFPTNLEAVFSSGLPTHNFHEAFPCTHVVNGLICLFTPYPELTLLNLTTGEKVSLPWSASTPQHFIEQFRSPCFFLGFDPRRKEYKLLCIHWNEFEENRCEILTLGTNSWRKLPYGSQFVCLKKGTICVNGRIYWKDNALYNNSGERVIQFFNVRKEKFGELVVPGCGRRVAQLTQIGQRIAFACRRKYWPHVLKLFVYNHEKKNWIKDVINLGWISISKLEVVGTTGKTDEILLTAKSRWSDISQLIFYDLGTGNLRTTKITCPGMPSEAAANIFSYVTSAAVSNHVENILPLDHLWKRTETVTTKKAKKKQKYASSLEYPIIEV